MVASLLVLKTGHQIHSLGEKKFSIGYSTNMPGYVIKLFGHCFRAKIVYDKAIRVYRATMNRYPEPENDNDSQDQALENSNKVNDAQSNYEKDDEIDCMEYNPCLFICPKNLE